ncbi:ComF family protein [Candidatus Saccharibacteria bacterium]|nr:ComF family protein [Candidatus Saccharibacteria bacterium]
MPASNTSPITTEVPATPLSCPKCTTDPDLPPAYVVSDRSGLLDLLIHEYKYDSVRALGHHLAELLDYRLPAFQRRTVIVPLPTATNHVRNRGFDHTLHLAKNLSHIRHCKITPLLIRAKNTTQVGADKNTREKQADSAYNLDARYQIEPDTTYLLLDDISTTGASIKSAVKKLRQAGANHIAIALLAVSILN